MSLRVVNSKFSNNEELSDIDLSSFKNKEYTDPLFEKSNKAVRVNDILFRGDFNFENYITEEGDLVLKFTDVISRQSICLYFDNITDVISFSNKIQSSMEFTTYGVNKFDVVSLFQNHFLYRRFISENLLLKGIQVKLNNIRNFLRVEHE